MYGIIICIFTYWIQLKFSGGEGFRSVFHFPILAWPRVSVEIFFCPMATYLEGSGFRAVNDGRRIEKGGFSDGFGKRSRWKFTLHGKEWKNQTLYIHI